MTSNHVSRADVRSGLEHRIGQSLANRGVPFDYEELKIRFTRPERVHTYTPDFVLHNGIIIEAKGRFDTPDRQKHLLIKNEFPLYDIRFVFSNAQQKISKRSKTTYAMWCEKHGYLYATEDIPLEWLQEPTKSLPY